MSSVRVLLAAVAAALTVVGAAGGTLVDDYFTQLLDRQNRLGLSPEGERGTKDAAFDDSEAA